MLARTSVVFVPNNLRLVKEKHEPAVAFLHGHLYNLEKSAGQVLSSRV